MIFQGFNPPPVHLTVISDHGGLGDSIARLPAFRYCLETYPHVSLTVHVIDAFKGLCEYLLPGNDRLTWKLRSEVPFRPRRPYVEFNPDRVSSLALGLTDQAFLMLMDHLPPDDGGEAANYPVAPLTENQAWLNQLCGEGRGAIVFTTDYTAPTRQWPVFQVNALAYKLNDLGFTCVLLGRAKPVATGVEDDPIKPNALDGLKGELFVDLRDKTTLIEALGVMQRSKAVLGVDNGLIHLAHCTSVPVVVGYTSLLAMHRLPTRPHGRTEYIQAGEGYCTGCQSKGFAVNHDWRVCINVEHPYCCQLDLLPDRFLNKLRLLGVIS